jgi:hypothetical protein
MGPLCSSETPVNLCRPTLRNVPEYFSLLFISTAVRTRGPNWLLYSVLYPILELSQPVYDNGHGEIVLCIILACVPYLALLGPKCA